MKIALLMILFVSAGYGGVSGNLRIAPAKDEVQMSDSSDKVGLDKEERIRLKIMSFNVRIGCGHDHPFRLERGSEGWLPQCAQVIRRFDPDFVGLQEVDRNSARVGFVDQTQVVAKHAGLHGEWVEKIPQYGISMLSKRKPVSVSKVLMRGSCHTRALMICDYGDMVVANTHFPLSKETRLEAVADVRRNLRELALKKPVFLMGDLNAVPDSPEILLLKEDFTVLSDETIPTWPAKKPKIMIDYIMVDKVHADKVKVISKHTMAAPEATDHSAIAVEVELNRRKVENPILRTLDAKRLEDLMLTKPDYVVYVPKQEMHLYKKTNPQEIGDRYNDHFQVLYDDKRKLYYAFWTQASWEGAGDHHIVFSKSADGGHTWTDPVTLAGSERRAYKRLGASWQQPMLSKSGRLYCYWNQKVRQGGCNELLYGFYSDDAGESWSDPVLVHYPRRPQIPGYIATVKSGWINWQRPLRLGDSGKYFVGCSRGPAIEFWQYENIDDDPPAEDLKISFFASGTNSLSRSRLAEKSDFKLNSGESRFEEAGVVKLPDGRLFALARTQVGYPVWSVSADGGRTWTDPKYLRRKDGAEPFLHPRSPCPIYDWVAPEAGSGRYFAFVHNKFNFENKRTASGPRGALYLIAGKFNPKAEQPIEFSEPKFFLERKNAWNSFYTSYTVVGEKRILWYPDGKHYLLGREIGEEWFE